MKLINFTVNFYVFPIFSCYCAYFFLKLQEFNFIINIFWYIARIQITYALSALKFWPILHKITKESDFHYDTIIFYIDIITCYSDLLLKLLESVISKLSIQIIWTSDSFVSFHHFQKTNLTKTIFLWKFMHISDKRNQFF